jgi:hypothetical protein
MQGVTGENSRCSMLVGVTAGSILARSKGGSHLFAMILDKIVKLA